MLSKSKWISWLILIGWITYLAIKIICVFFDDPISVISSKNLFEAEAALAYKNHELPNSSSNINGALRP